MYSSAVADAGGLLTAADVVEGLRQEVGEYVALDTTTLTLAEVLGIPLVTKHDAVSSKVIPVLHS